MGAWDRDPDPVLSGSSPVRSSGSPGPCSGSVMSAAEDPPPASVPVGSAPPCPTPPISQPATPTRRQSSSSGDTPPTATATATATAAATATAIATAPNPIQPAASKADLELLARLEEQNRLLESDSKSLNSLTSASGHSRKSSDTSQVSVTSGTSQQSAAQEEDVEDVWLLWGRIVNEWDTYVKKKNAYVKDLVRKGVPQHFRGIVWQLLCSSQGCSARENYAEYMKSTSPCEKVIRRDIARTYPEHEFFREKDGAGQEGLFNVMKAYSLHDREVGYCQGSAFIVGLLLLQMPEEEAFAVLVQLMHDYRLREMYKPSMAELGLRMYQLECTVQEFLPELHMHFQSQSFHTSMYASSWFLTLFTSTLSLNLASRVMDLFLSEGIEMIFRIAIGILQFCKEDLLQLDMEGMLRYFQKEMPSKCETDPDYLISLALQVKYNAKKIKKLEKDYMTVKVKEQEELIELRRLRTENRLLKQRIEHLEQESASLADRLIQGQVIRAQEAEDNYVIKRELAAVKQHEQETQQELDKAYQTIKQLNEVGTEPGTLSQAEELMKSLQDELVSVKLREAESHVTMQELRQRIQELEEGNKRLREAPPDNNVASLQEELIAVKLREAEANLSMKELRQKVTDLQAEWEKHLSESTQTTDSPALLRKRDKTAMTQLQEDLMTAKLREAEAVAELKELRQKVMELETQNQVSLNQIRRQSEEVTKLQQRQEDLEQREKNLLSQLKEEKRKYTDLESKMAAEQMMIRIKELEQTQTIAELKQKVSALEVKSQELLTAGQLRGGNEVDEVKDLQDRNADLQAEVLRLETLNKKLTSAMTIQSLRRDSKSSNPSDSPTRNGSTYLDGLSAFSRSSSVTEDLTNEHLVLDGTLHQLTNHHSRNNNNKMVINGDA